MLLKKTALLLLASVLVFQSCNDDLDTPLIENKTITSNEAINIQEAKNYYYNQLKNLRKNSDESKIPIWDDASQRKVSSTESIITVPILYLKPITVKIRDNRPEKKKNEEDIDITGDIMTSLIFIKVDSKIELYESELIPDDDYYKKKKTKLDIKDFDGYAIFYDNNKKVVKGLVYQNGKVKATFGGVNKNARIHNAPNICIDHYERVCLKDANGNLVDCTDWQYSFSSGDCEPIDLSGIGVNTTLYSNAVEILSSSSSGSTNLLNSVINLNNTTRNLWNELNQVEKDYFTGKPWLLLGSFLAKQLAIAETHILYCNQLDGNNGNAFKHAFWAALLYSTLGKHAAMEITDNHEAVYDANNPDVVKWRQMDLYNNNLGIDTYYNIRLQVEQELHPLYKLNIIINAISQRINLGYGKRLTSLENGTLINTDNTEHCND